MERASYEIEFSHRASKQFADLQLEIQERIAPRIDGLATDPRPSGCVKLTDSKNAYRIRVGDYRIVYTINDELDIIEVVLVKHRSQAYR